jgi:hypothetical protein
MNSRRRRTSREHHDKRGRGREMTIRTGCIYMAGAGATLTTGCCTITGGPPPYAKSGGGDGGACCGRGGVGRRLMGARTDTGNNSAFSSVVHTPNVCRPASDRSTTRGVARPSRPVPPNPRPDTYPSLVNSLNPGPYLKFNAASDNCAAGWVFRLLISCKSG